MEAAGTKVYTAVFPNGAWAEQFAARIQEDGFHATNVARKARSRTVTFEGPATQEYFLDLLETVGYYGSPPQGRQATLNDVRAPHSY